MEQYHIIHIPNTNFKLSPNQPCSGDFYLNFTPNGFNFEFIPLDKSIFAELDLQESQCRISFFLYEVKEIAFSKDEIKTVYLNFIFYKGMSFSPFYFPIFYHATVQHLLDFLLFKKKIQLIQVSNPSRYSVIDKQINRVHQPHNLINDNEEFISPKHLTYLIRHKQIVQKIQTNDLSEKDEPLTLDDCLSFFQENGICNHFENLKREIFRRGLTNEARTRIWPLLLGLFSPQKTQEENNNFLKRKLVEYQTIRNQWDSIIKSQEDEVTEIAELIRVVENDVKRTDRLLPQFKNDDHPNLVLLHNVLISYALYNRDTGYVQGMGDLVSPFIILFIKDWKDPDHAILYDNRVIPRIEAESLMLWLLCSLMTTMQQDRMFTDLAKHQQFVMERAYAIIKSIHKPLNEWLDENELTELFFLYRPILLLFKREFDYKFVFRLWDCFFSHSKPYTFPRFFLSAVLIELFPRLMLHTKGGMGDVMSLTDKIIGSLNGYSTLNIAIGLQEKMNEAGKAEEWALQPLPEVTEYRSYRSQFLNV